MEWVHMWLRQSRPSERLQLGGRLLSEWATHPELWLISQLSVALIMFKKKHFVRTCCTLRTCLEGSSPAGEVSSGSAAGSVPRCGKTSNKQFVFLLVCNLVLSQWNMVTWCQFTAAPPSGQDLTGLLETSCCSNSWERFRTTTNPSLMQTAAGWTETLGFLWIHVKTSFKSTFSWKMKLSLFFSYSPSVPAGGTHSPTSI